MSRWRCPESGKATGELVAPRRRFPCAVCGARVRHVAWGEHIVVALHYVPKITSVRPPARLS